MSLLFSFFFNWRIIRIITLQNFVVFCQTSTWWVYPLVKCLFKVFAQFSIDYSFFNWFKSFLYTLDIGMMRVKCVINWWTFYCLDNCLPFHNVLSPSLCYLSMETIVIIHLKESHLWLFFFMVWVYRSVWLHARTLSHAQLSEMPRTVAHQAPLSMEFSGQESWSGLPFPSPISILS